MTTPVEVAAKILAASASPSDGSNATIDKVDESK
jgi:hypothetical protein